MASLSAITHCSSGSTLCVSALSFCVPLDVCSMVSLYHFEPKSKILLKVSQKVLNQETNNGFYLQGCEVVSTREAQQDFWKPTQKCKKLQDGQLLLLMLFKNIKQQWWCEDTIIPRSVTYHCNHRMAYCHKQDWNQSAVSHPNAANDLCLYTRMVSGLPLKQKNAGLSEVSEGLGLLFQPQTPRGMNIKQHARQKDVDNILKPKTVNLRLLIFLVKKGLLRCRLDQCCTHSKAEALATLEFIMSCCEYRLFLFTLASAQST